MKNRMLVVEVPGAWRLTLSVFIQNSIVQSGVVQPESD